MKSVNTVVCLLFSLVSMATTSLSQAAVSDPGPKLLYVDDNAIHDPAPFDANTGDPNEDGSWDHPFDSIQEAVDCAGDGATILIQPGRYNENLQIATKAVHLVGMVTDEPDLAVIDGLNRSPVIRITQVTDPNCLIQGLALIHGQGILGGAVECRQSQVRIANCLINGNQATDPNGAVVFCDRSQMELRYCTLSDNTDGPQGAALVCNRSLVTVNNSIVWGNDSPGIKVLDANLPLITYSDIEGGWPGVGNIDANPQFVQPQEELGYQLESTSPCINQGDPNTILSSVFLDLNGDVRILNSRVDMGADEFNPLTVSIPSNEPISIPDIRLKAAIESILGKADPTDANMLDLLDLDASARSITDLTGLEYARNLQTLDLHGNPELEDLTPLAGLMQLRTLDLHSDQIKDLAPLAGLTELHTALLQGNDINDISILGRMPHMQILLLTDNLIRDITPLTYLTSLQQLDLLQNPLNDEACDTDIPQIVANNPGVDLSYRPCGPYRLTLSSTGGGHVATPDEGIFLYDYGTAVTIQAEPDPGYRFINFTGSLISQRNPLSVTLKTDTHLQAHFEATGNFVSIPDAGLKDAIETTLGKVNPTPDDMLKLIHLDASHRSIRSLTGLEYATNLQWLDVQRNRNISDLTPLTGLVQLQYLDLNNNRIKDLSALAGMIHLTYLDIHDNLVDSIAPLATLAQLRTAILYRNDYSDISSLAGLTHLEDLQIHENLISDISPLLQLTSLQKLNITRNPVNYDTCEEYTSEIRANNPGLTTFVYHCGPLILNISSTTGGHVSIPGEGSFPYDYGTKVMLQADPDPGYRFVNFTGNFNTTQNPTFVTVVTDFSVQANFEPK